MKLCSVCFHSSSHFPRLSLSPGDALDPRDERAASGSLSASLVHHGVNSSPQKRRVRRHTVLDNLAPLAEYSADFLVPPRPQTPAQRGFFRSHLLVICAAKPRYTTAAAREHPHALAPRLPGASVTSPLHTPLSPPTTHPECSPNAPLVLWMLRLAP